VNIEISLRTRKRFPIAIALLMVLPAALPFSESVQLTEFFRPGAVRVLILSGRNNHDWRTTTPFLQKLLVESGRFDVRVCEEPAGLTSEALLPYDVLIVDYCGPRWGASTEKAIEGFVKSGKGMAVVHGASYAFAGLDVLADGHKSTGIKEAPWSEYGRMVGGRWTGTPPKQFHGRRHSFAVKGVRRDHPILEGMPETFIATDELYHQMLFYPETTVLAAAFDDPQMGGTGKEEPMLTATQYGNGRVFYTALGHEVPAMQERGFMATFLRGTEWAATGKVTLPPNAGSTKPKQAPLRILVVTGGHDYEASFYTLFEGQADLIWTHAATSKAAFASDIRRTCDVLVLYDMSAELEEKGRANLRDFLESGKGVVVLHHAIADYPSWSWWSKEVVGGKYLLKEEGGMPASTYKHDEELFVRPAAQHPIVSGIGPMHLWDETYKGMWISPDVQVLLKTDNPTSDGPVAWISPYQKSRVVYVQLGHDSAAYRYSAYRTLVRNAIFWTAGK
jgi:type 1 glutamine amidotransferase